MRKGDFSDDMMLYVDGFCDSSCLKGGVDCLPDSGGSGVKSRATNETVLQDPAV